jgi:hypothetical protein
MTPTLFVRYSCPGCGIVDRPVSVPLRGEEDVIQWLDIVMLAVGDDHKRHSPFCKATHMRDLKIPMPAGTTKVGGPVAH